MGAITRIAPTRRGISTVGANLVFAPHPIRHTRPRGTLPDMVGRIVQAFKSITIYPYITGVQQHCWPWFGSKLWQRNYWEHLVRNGLDGNPIREYIRNNLLQWQLDQLNPLCAQRGSKA